MTLSLMVELEQHHHQQQYSQLFGTDDTSVPTVASSNGILTQSAPMFGTAGDANQTLATDGISIATTAAGNAGDCATGDSSSSTPSLPDDSCGDARRPSAMAKRVDDGSSAPYKMGYFGATSYVIGNIIGSGIFITPSTVVRCTDSVALSLLVWVVGALIAFLGSLCYIELGTSIREAGCDFAYICYVKWHSIAFSFMWVSVLMTYPATIAVIAETFGQYLMEGLRHFYAVPAEWAPVAQKCFGIALLWLITWMNFFAIGKFAARFQIAATVAKLLSCALIIVMGFYHLFFKGAAFEQTMDQNTKWNVGELMMALYGGLYAYSGWDILNYGTDEIQKPRRNAPLALLSGILIVFLIYFCINIAFFAVLDIHTMKTSNAVAALFSQRTLGPFSEAIPFLIGILLVGSLNSNLFCGSRYMYAAARQGQLPSCFSCVNAVNESPRVAVFAQSALAVAISFVGDLDALIGYVMFGFWAQRVFTLCALLTIRYRQIPVHSDAIRIPLPCIFLFLLINIVLVAIPIWREFAVTSLGISICVLGLGFYFVFFRSPNGTSSFLSSLNEKSTFFASILFDALPDLKQQNLGKKHPTVLLPSDSQRELLLPTKFDSLDDQQSADLPSPTVPDLHSDEKNTMIRNGSATGLRMW
ncbi:hypothetical protein niasHT_007652 [Heterodera trifolii]|uniref:Amino acid transporter n=1 Tax=Heterodera trifolii TaxID=157864 RepID=A0ABD2LSH2_9BILA